MNSARKEIQTIKLGVISGPHLELILRFVCAKEDVNVDIFTWCERELDLFPKSDWPMLLMASDYMGMTLLSHCICKSIVHKTAPNQIHLQMATLPVHLQQSTSQYFSSDQLLHLYFSLNAPADMTMEQLGFGNILKRCYQRAVDDLCKIWQEGFEAMTLDPDALPLSLFTLVC